MSRPPREPERSRARRFVTCLQELVDRNDRGALAALRRGLGKAPGEAAEMFPHVVPRLPQDLPEGEEARYYLVASLFAFHHKPWPQANTKPREPNLGASFRLLEDTQRKRRDARPGDQQGESAVARRFTVLLAAHREDLPDRLRHAISLLKSEEVPVDYAQLLEDLRWWDHEERHVQRCWARAFWASVAEEPSEGVAGGPAEGDDTPSEETDREDE